MRSRSGNMSVAEIARKLDMPENVVEEAYKTGDPAFIKSLEDEAGADGGLTLSCMLGFDDESFTLIENHDFMQYCISKLKDREAELFRERFYGTATQRELAEKWDVSQMYVSRLEKSVTDKLKNLYMEVM